MSDNDCRRFLAHDQEGRIVQAPNGLPLPPHVIATQKVFVAPLGFVSFAHPNPVTADIGAALSREADRAAGSPAVNPPEAALTPPSMFAQPPAEGAPQAPPQAPPMGPPPGFGVGPQGAPPFTMGPPAGFGFPGGVPQAPPQAAPMGPPPGFGFPGQVPQGPPPQAPPHAPALPDFAPEAPKAEPEEPKATKGKKASKALAKAAEGLFIGELFVDCIPHGEECEDLGAYVARAEKSADPRAHVLASIEERSPEKLHFSSASVDGSGFRDALVGRAKRVIKGAM